MADKTDQVIKKLEKIEDEIAALKDTLQASIKEQSEAIQELADAVNTKLKGMEHEIIGTIKRAG